MANSNVVGGDGGDGTSLQADHVVVLTSVYRGLLHAAHSCGLTVSAELWQVEKRHRDLEYIDHVHFRRLWDELANDADPMLGLRLGLALDVRYLGIVGALLYCCSDLRSAIVSFEDFAIMLREPRDMHVGLEGDALPTVSPSVYPHWHLRSLTGLGVVIRLVSEITGHQVRTPARVLLAFPPRAPLERYIELVGCPVEAAQHQHAILYSEAQGRTALRYADRALERRLRRVAAQSLSSRSHDSLQARVRDTIIAEPRLSKEQVAERLGMSSRTLHRLLEAEGLSFTPMSNAAREQLARAALRDTDDTLAEIATYLGFADESSFSRAFKRWTGVTPGEFREHSR